MNNNGCSNYFFHFHLDIFVDLVRSTHPHNLFELLATLGSTGRAAKDRGIQTPDHVLALGSQSGHHCSRAAAKM